MRASNEKNRKRDRKIDILKAAMALVVIVLIGSCAGEKKKYAAALAEEGAAPSVSTAIPLVEEVVLYKEYPGYITSEKSAALVARVNGYLNEICYTPGQSVKKGDLLFIIEPTLYQNAVNQAEAELASAQAQLVYAGNNYDKIKEASLSDAVSEIDVIQAKSQMEQAKASVGNAQAQLSTATTNLGYCYVKAPFSGKVSMYDYNEGAYLSGSAQPVTLAEIYQDTNMYVNFSISDNFYLTMLLENTDKNARSGMLPDSISISLGGDENPMKYSGKVDYLSPNIELSTGSLNFRGILANKDGVLKDGMYATISLPYKRVENAILINNASIGTNQAGKYIYVVNDSSVVQMRHITVGSLVNDSLRVVTSGMAPGERYITKALLKMRNGMKVKVLDNK